MIRDAGETRRDIIIAILAAVIIAALFYQWQGRIGVGLADEGFLWYGIQQTALGEVAIRDFQSYDPARYEFCALGSRVFGDGFRGMRKSIAIFQAIGLSFGLLMMQRVYGNWALSIVAGLAIYMMFFPSYKSFEPAWAMALVYACVRLLDSPVARMHFIAGVAVGLGAFIGRNVGVYGLIGVSAMAAYLWATGHSHGTFMRRALALASGVLLGYSPMLIMFALNPGLFQSLIDSLALMFSNEGTNISKPVPWPWALQPLPAWLPRQYLLSNAVLSAYFVIMPIYYAVVWGAHLIRRWRFDTQARAVVSASAAIGLPFMHHAFARPDLSHMSEAASPLVLGLLSMPVALGLSKGTVSRAAIAILVLITALLMTGMRNPGYMKWAFKDSTVEMNIKGERAEIFAGLAPEIAYALELDQRVPSEEMIFIAPHKPGLYAVMRRKSPIPETYLLLNVTEQRQQDMVKELMLGDVKWALIEDSKIDDREDMIFRNQYQIVYKYLTDEFDPVADEGLPPGYALFKKRDG